MRTTYTVYGGLPHTIGHEYSCLGSLRTADALATRLRHLLPPDAVVWVYADTNVPLRPRDANAEPWGWCWTDRRDETCTAFQTRCGWVVLQYEDTRESAGVVNTHGRRAHWVTQRLNAVGIECYSVLDETWDMDATFVRLRDLGRIYRTLGWEPHDLPQPYRSA
jgi:hypothetical protein